MLNLGNKAKDKITGFTGVLTGRAEYLTGCTQYSLQPECKEDGSFISANWFDEGRLIDLGNSIESKDVIGEKNGADFSAPIK